MAAKKGRFSVNTNRIDPYKNFKFRMMVASALAAIAGLALVKKLLPAVSARYLNPQDYVSEVPSGPRPIEGVGTSTASGRTAAKPKKPRPSGRPASRAGTRKEERRRSQAALTRRRRSSGKWLRDRCSNERPNMR